MRRLMTHAGANLHQPEVLTPTNLAFHQQIAAASGNTVLHQVLEVLCNLFHDEQRTILDIHGSWERDHAEHLGILEALERRDEVQAVERMRSHLEELRNLLVRWQPDTAR